MRRIVLFLLGSILVVLGAYAGYSTLFPADSVLPRIPAGVATLGGVFEKILGITALEFENSTGVVANAYRLGGRTPDFYMKAGSPTCGIGEAWTKIDATGRAICEAIGPTTTLAMIGKGGSLSGTALVYQSSGAIVSLIAGMRIYDGDIIKTDIASQSEIIFLDDSVIRLGPDTTLALNVGANTGSGQIAQLILENGNLWGRILTQTGVYNIGTEDIIAAVRGTSVALSFTGHVVTGFTYNSLTASGWSFTKTAPLIRGIPPTLKSVLTIVDSSLSNTGRAADVECLGDSSTLPLGVEQTIVSDGKCANQSPTTTIAANLYSTSDKWIRDNTLRDIDYIDNLLSISGTVRGDGTTPTGIPNVTLSGGLAKQLKLISEFQASVPTGPTELGDICGGEDQVWNTRFSRCMPENMVAFTDFRGRDFKLRYKDNSRNDLPNWSLSPGIPLGDPQNIQNGIYISGGNYLEYSGALIRQGGGFNIGSFSGIQVIIETSQPIDFGPATRYLLSIFSTQANTNKFQAFWNGSALKCINGVSTPYDCIRKLTSNRYVVTLPSRDIYDLDGTSIFRVGNNTNLQYAYPTLFASISTTIRTIMVINPNQ